MLPCSINRNANWNKITIRSIVDQCINLCSLCCILCLILLTILSLIFYILSFETSVVQILFIDVTKPATHYSNERFLSLGLDDIVLAKGFENFNMTNISLINNVKYLSPAYLRIGGNLADKLIFSPNDFNGDDENLVKFYATCDIRSCDSLKAPNFTLSGSDWLKLAKFAELSQLDIIFDLNALIRFENGAWDYRNAESLIRFSSDHNLSVNWELGNEPNSYRHKFNEEVNATQMAKDFIKLRQILNKYPKYNSSLLVGPDTTRFRNKQIELYLEEFMETAKQVIDAVTWHHYYFNGRTAKSEDFLDPSIFDTLQDQITDVKNILENVTAGNKPVWLGETSSAYGGGAPGLSDRFIASFIWMDKLGLSAKMGLDVVVRQSIFYGSYALLDDHYNPNPDWWISILYKLIVGPRTVPYYTACSPNVRLYCHCTNKLVFGRNLVPSLTVFGMNLGNSPATVRIEGLKDCNKLKIYSFELTTDSLLSKNVFLNGHLLKMGADGKLPEFIPKLIVGDTQLIMPPHSIVFWVIADVKIRACPYHIYKVF